MGASRSSSQDRTRETTEEELECQTCRCRFVAQVLTYTVSGKERTLRPKECDACRVTREREEQIEAEAQLELATTRLKDRWRLECGIPEWMLAKRFENFEARFQREAFRVSKQYSDDFPSGARPYGYPSLVLHSEGPGCGKTHLMVAIANAVIDSWSGASFRTISPVRFESGPGLIRRIRATYNRRENWQETEEDVYNDLKGVWLLFLDDVGKEKPSDHTREVYFYIIDERYKAGLPVVISSNLPVEGANSLKQLMGETTVDRLVGMTRGKIIRLKGESYRQLTKQP